MVNSFRDGALKMTGTDIDRTLSPLSRFGGGSRAKKKQTVIEKLKAFFEKYFGLGINSFADELKKTITYDFTLAPLMMVAEESAKFDDDT